MSILELIGATLGLVSVFLTVRQNIWCWPIGALMVALYVKIFADARLYADAGLQAVYFILQIYGWYKWTRGKRLPKKDQELPVSRTPLHWHLPLLVLGSLGTFALGTSLARFTDQDLAYWDSGITVFSLIAQVLMAQKRLECWLLWAVIDVVATGVYTYKGLYPTALLYAVFTVLALLGHISWKRSLHYAAA